MKKISILFVHPLTGNAYELYKAFDRNPNVNVIPLINTTEEPRPSLMSKIRHKLKIHQDTYGINAKLLTYDLSDIDILFIVKGNEIHPKTLQTIKKKYLSLKLISWALDDMFAWHNRSIFYTFSLQYYDHVFTTKSYNLNELPHLGAKQIHYINQAYSQDIHQPDDASIKSPKYNVLFIGFPEKERFNSLEYLAQHGISINIFGYASKWAEYPYSQRNTNLILHHQSVYGLEYAKSISSAKITLCFLRKINRDLHTSRSIEIPACGGFMIAERTSEHSELFAEDREAVYFSSDQELLEKVRYYLEHDDERKAIAEAGLKRCHTSGYSYDDMVEIILKVLDEN